MSPGDPGEGLRVVHVVRSGAFAGVERYIATVSREQALRGVDVVVVGGDPSRMAPHWEAVDVRYHPASTTAAAFWHLARTARHSVVHVHMTAAGAAAVLARPVTGRPPLVVTRHFARARARTIRGRVAAKAIARSSARQIAISDFVARSLGEGCVTIPNGVPQAREGLRRYPVVLMAQRLEAEKNTSLGVTAWARSGLAAEGWRLVIAGEGAQRRQLEELASRLGIAASVDFVGDQPKLDPLLDDASVFLSTAGAEPFGLSVVEAMAKALPVVASAGGAHTETVGGCSTEWLFSPDDAATCADRLRSLCHDPALRVSYGRALQIHQRRCYNLSNHVDRVLALYEEVLSGSLSLSSPRRRL